MEKVQKIIQKITDVVSILGPAVIGVVEVLDAKDVIIVEGGYKITLIVLAAASSIASVIYNIVNKQDTDTANS